MHRDESNVPRSLLSSAVGSGENQVVVMTQVEKYCT